MKRIKILLLLLIFVPLIQVHAQYPYIKSTGFSGYLQEADINQVIQATDGFIWLATSQGLFRFNGYEFEKTEGPLESKYGEITALFEKEGEMWIGTSKGHIYILKDNRLAPLQPEEGYPKSAITDILAGNNNRIWFATYGEGIYYYEKNRLYLIDEEDGLSDEYIYDLELDNQGNVWAGSDGGINICRIEADKKNIRHIGMKEGLPDILVTSLCLHQGKMYIGMQDQGVTIYNPTTERFEEESIPITWNYGRVNAIMPLQDQLWIGTDNHGLIELHLSSGGILQHYTTKNGISMRRIRDIIKCKFGNVWIAASKELLVSTGEKFEYIDKHEGISFADPLAIATDSKNNIWFSNNRGLFSHQNRFTGNNVVKKYFQGEAFKDINIMSIYEDARGFIWAGTFGNGLYMLHPGSGQYLHFTEADGLINENVLSIDGNGHEIWLATLAGVEKCMLPSMNYYQKKLYEFTGFKQEHGLGNNFVYCVFIDHNNNIWFGTDGNGITCYNREKFITYNSENSNLQSNIVYSVTEDTSGNMWFSAANKGLYFFDGNEFKNYGRKEGVRSLEIWGLETDKNGNIIIAHDAGIDVLNPADNSIVHYGEDVGIDQMNPNLNTIARDQEGNIWLGSQNGIIRYMPSAVDAERYPLTRITGISVYLQPVEFGKQKFSWDQNHISFSYLGLWYLNPAAVNYTVMLQGHDIDWIETKNRSVTYSDLPPGDYTFKVRSTVTGEVSNAELQTYSFSIARPFWASFWFYLLLVAVLFAMVYYYIKFRERRLRREEMLKKEKLEFEFQTLKNQVNPHFLFNSFSTLISLIEDDKNIAVEYVEKLSGFFRNILKYRDMKVISLQEELQVIETYFFLQKKRYGKNLKTKILIPEAYLQTFIPPLTLQMIVENAMKHNVISRNKPLLVKILIEDEKIMVENNLQPKKSAEDSTGVGMKNIADRYRILFNKEMKVEKSEQIYRVILPVIKPISI